MKKILKVLLYAVIIIVIAVSYTHLNISLDLHNSDYEGNVMTEYEKKFSEMGQPIFRLEGYFNKLPDDLEKKDE